MENKIEECNDAVAQLLSSGMQRMLGEAAARDRKRKQVEQRPARPITAMPIVGGDISLGAEIIRHRDRAVLVSNDTCEIWLPRSQVRRVVKHQVIVTEWIAAKKHFYLQFLKNQSPQYQDWLAKVEADRKRARDNPYRGPGFQCKFDHM